jgi:aspartyl-tRNA(Asn)/glutamyl-tRNA(Gln) amidotransferase subunit A
LVLGVPEPYFCDRLHPEVRAALVRTRQALSRAGHQVRTIAIEHAARTADVYLHIVLPEASWYHAPLLAAHADRYSPGVRLRLEMGRYVLAEDYVRAMQLREVLRRAVDTALRGCDALLLPSQPLPAPELGVAMVDIDGTKEPVRGAMLRLTQLFYITGHPAIALPAGTTRDGWPVGLQLVGHFGAASQLIQLAARVEPYSTGGDGSVGGGTG